MNTDKTLDDLFDKIKEIIGDSVSLTGIDYEGPDIVIYTSSPEIFAENENIIRNLARDLKKRVVIRPDRNALTDPESAIEKIKSIVPDDAEVKNFYFDTEKGEVTIEAYKPGLVIGKRAATLREISRIVGWSPKVVRVPPIESQIIKNTRDFLKSVSNDRSDFLKRVGHSIHREITSKEKWVRITFLGGCREVGRCAYLLSTPETKILIECGINVNSENNTYPFLNLPEITPLNDLDGVVITHAHLDHSGLVPLLYKYGYDGPIYLTYPTRDLMTLLQLDYIDVSAREGKEIPYNSAMVREALKHTIPINYGSVTDIAPDMHLTLHNAGHILGSASVHFHIGTGLCNVVFTGDMKYEKTLLFDPATVNFPRVEQLIIESTYGGSKDLQPSRRWAEKRLQGLVNEVTAKNGKVLIPTFAVGRSQEVMIVLENAIRNKNIEKLPIYLDGMIWEATAIHTAYPEYLNSNLRNMIFHDDLNPFLSDCFIRVDSASKRDEAMESGPGIILATSGMLNGGPILEYLRHLGQNDKNMLIFVGYQAEGTLGKRIQNGWKEIPLSSDGRTDVIKLNLNIQTVDGFSGHSDRQQLMEYIKNLNQNPKQIFVTHGEESKCIDFANSIYKRYKIEAIAPKNLETVRLL
ncbi:MAG: beta-CASP ribonuclease aCPSF1 [Candidatus Methanoliparum thermophilum]|uniref:Transcription termination factor FttA n=1 Tax=Methanoliparum thermophilum TaxID=2491083 RepID=A0A520KUN5_METT2|nr:beta-CASP ribonuclease aCPSF1 [Candidatus Methanoliparum sp. LAM-1]RZN65411.1 MAG: beta-CASP ribonuclease aCPSF1 [Candidatus Methanoliparum thermophilum]BDC35500.1 hypothetical protein MTLP_01820 [Candidatus Methanoliparum sp. LAM-1]